MTITTKYDLYDVIEYTADKKKLIGMIEKITYGMNGLIYDISTHGHWLYEKDIIRKYAPAKLKEAK